VSHVWGVADFGRDGVSPSFSGFSVEFGGVQELSHLSITANAEIHNRADLISGLGSDLEHARDSDLLLSAYAKWGDQCAARLLGDFAFAIWDDRLKRLFCCRDHLAARPFFYWHKSSRFIFGSDPASILKAPGVAREFNRTKLAAMSASGGKNFRDEETFYSGILSLPGGSCMTVDRHGIRKWAYWDPENSPVSAPTRDNEVFEGLRELIFASVRARLRGRSTAGAFLSGGLDSSAVVAIAARCLEKDNRPLITLSSVMPDPSPPGLTDEREYIDEFRSWPNVRREYVTAPGRGPFDHIEDLSYFERAFTWSSRHYLYNAFQETAAARGLDVLMDGVGGELGPSCWGQDYHLELAASLRWTTLARELAGRRAVRGTHPIRTLASQARNSLLPNRSFQPLHFFTPALIRECDAPHQGKRHWPNQRGSQAAMLRLFLQRHANVQPESPPAPYCYPLLDKRIVEFCIAAPSRLKVRDGYDRYLIRGALDGILPRKIQWRTTKKPFAPDYYVRFNAQLPKAREFVAAIGARDPVRSIIDVDLLAKLLVPVDPVKGKWEALVSVPGTIYLIAFLRQFAEFRP
jgi:asparagine synthase (glutamine-hydrolysing)